MNLPGWNPAWHRGGESIVSVALKVAYGNSSTVGDVLSGLVNASPSFRLPVMFPTSTAAVRAWKLLGLLPDVASSLFAGIGEPAFTERDLFCHSLRWCPACIADRYHAWTFQKWNRHRCDLHAEPLMEGCPRCHRLVDPMAMEGWHCPVCKQPFATVHAMDWKRFPSRSSCGSKRHRDGTLPDLGVEILRHGSAIDVVHRAPLAFGISNAGEGRASDDATLRWHAWEQCSAIVDCLFGAHRDCVAAEWAASHAEHGFTTFCCPLGAAAAQTLAWLGCRHERRGGWPGERPQGADDLPLIQSAIGGAPAWLIPLLMREAALEWMSMAVSCFATAAQRGLLGLAWRPPRRLGMTWQVNGDAAHVATIVRSSNFMASIATGAKACSGKAGPLLRAFETTPGAAGPLVRRNPDF